MADSPRGARHPEIRELRALLRDSAARRSAGRFVLEGPRLVADALARGVALDAVYLGQNSRAAFAALTADLDAAGTPVHELREGVLEKLGTTRTPQPVLGVTPIPAEVGLDAIPEGLLVVADGVSDPGNLGTIVRSAEAAGAAAVLVVGGVDPRNPKVVRASAGSVLGLPVRGVTAPELEDLRSRGWRLVALDGAATLTYTSFDWTGAVAVVVGSEAGGVSAEVAACVDGSVAIPMAGPVESLNAGVAASVALFEAARQRSR